MSTELSLKQIQKEYHGTFKSYVIGFIFSLLLTIVSFSLVIMKYFSNQVTIYVIAGLALMQAIVQLLLFLHVGQEAKPRWETIVFYFMVLVLVIIVLGTLWIMHDLDVRMMSEMTREMKHD